jgi:RNA polymerase sigma-70 factor, ECF subfamily
MADLVDSGLWAEIRAAWPDIAVGPDVFAAHVATLDLADVRAADLYLACACCAGDPAALAAFEDLMAPARGTLLRAGYPAALVDEALQTVRYRLLVTTPHREAKLRTYRGRGTLAGWLRVVVLRQIRALAGPRTAEQSDAALAAAAADEDVTLALLVRAHGPAIRRMFRDALATLDERERALLRLEIVDSLPHQQIAAIHGVHRTTALRWIDDARGKLAREVRRRIKRDLGISDESAESLLRTLAGHIELSLGSGLISAA